MSKLNEYIEQIETYKNQHPGISEEKLIRYVYLKLGEKFSFDLNFAFGNAKTKKRIYDGCIRDNNINIAMETNTAICKSISYILEYILKKFGVNIRTVVDPRDDRKCPHMYNIITPKSGEEYIVDLQEDLENIKSHSFTKKYGLSTKINLMPVIRRFDIEQMDRELGYIDDEHYYADDYLYLLKSDIGYFTDFGEKVKFVLENIDIHENKNIQYAERRLHHEKLLLELFSDDELNRIHIIDCYKEVEGVKQYKNCIAIDRAKAADVYMYSIEENRYCKMTIQEFAKQVQNGLVCLQGVFGLKQAIKQLQHQEDEER